MRVPAPRGARVVLPTSPLDNDRYVIISLNFDLADGSGRNAARPGR